MIGVKLNELVLVIVMIGRAKIRIGEAALRNEGEVAFGGFDFVFLDGVKLVEMFFKRVPLGLAAIEPNGVVQFAGEKPLACFLAFA